MIDITRIKELERRLGRESDPDLEPFRDQLEAATSETVGAQTEAYRAKLIEVLGGEGPHARRSKRSLQSRSPSTALGLLAAEAAPLVRQAIAARRELDGTLRIGPAAADLGATAASVAGRAHRRAAADRLARSRIRRGGTPRVRRRIPARERGRRGAGRQPRRREGHRRGPRRRCANAVSVLALLRAEFRPTGIQLGLGFSLDAVGGIVGVHRTATSTRSAAGSVDGSATEALFGGSTSASGIRSTLDALSAMFPAAADHVVVGPTFRIGWLNAGGTSLVTARHRGHPAAAGGERAAARARRARGARTGHPARAPARRHAGRGRRAGQADHDRRGARRLAGAGGLPNRRDGRGLPGVGRPAGVGADRRRVLPRFRPCSCADPAAEAHLALPLVAAARAAPQRGGIRGGRRPARCSSADRSLPATTSASPRSAAPSTATPSSSCPALRRDRVGGRVAIEALGAGPAERRMPRHDHRTGPAHAHTHRDRQDPLDRRRRHRAVHALGRAAAPTSRPPM